MFIYEFIPLLPVLIGKPLVIVCKIVQYATPIYLIILVVSHFKKDFIFNRNRKLKKLLEIYPFLLFASFPLRFLAGLGVFADSMHGASLGPTF